MEVPDWEPFNPDKAIISGSQGGGHGDYKVIVLAPASVQEMYDFVGLAFDLAFKYRTPVMILSDGAIGQMMEKVELREPVRRLTDRKLPKSTVIGPPLGNNRTAKETSFLRCPLEASEMETINLRLQAKYNKIKEHEVRYEKLCDDAEYLLVAFGSSARICESTISARKRH